MKKNDDIVKGLDAPVGGDSRATWLERRKRGIGGSDAPVIMGVSNFKSRYTLWAEKVGLVDEVDLSDVEAIQWGKRLEGVILDAYAEESGRKVKRVEPYKIFRVHSYPPHSVSYTKLFCTPDALQEDKDGARGVIEVKNVGSYMAKEWEAGAPEQYQIQLFHNMHVVSTSWGTLVALIGGNSLVWYDYRIEGNAVIQKKMNEILLAEDKFWKSVLSETPPEIDDSKSTKMTLGVIGDVEETSILLSAEGCTRTDRVDELALTIKNCKPEEARLKNEIRKEIGGNTQGVLPDGSGWTYKANKSGSRILRRFYK